MVEWTNEMALQFIQLFKDHPELWKSGFQIPHSERDVAWNEISSQMGGVDPDELRRKHGTLMSNYRKQLWKIHRKPGHVPKWFCFNEIHSFLQRAPQTNLLRKKRKVPKDEDAVEEVLDEDEGNTFWVDTPLQGNSEDEEGMSETVADSDIRRRDRTTVRDECDAFGVYIAEVLRKMSKRERAEAKKEISNVIFNIEMTDNKDDQL